MTALTRLRALSRQDWATLLLGIAVWLFAAIGVVTACGWLMGCGNTDTTLLTDCRYWDGYKHGYDDGVRVRESVTPGPTP